MRTEDNNTFVGSSPRVRGAVSTDSAMLDGYGIIPARAGSSLMRSDLRCWYRDHPRACGEQDREQGVDDCR